MYKLLLYAKVGCGCFFFLVASFQFGLFAVGVTEIIKQSIIWVPVGFLTLVSEVNYVNTCGFFNLKTNLLSSPFVPLSAFS